MTRRGARCAAPPLVRDPVFRNRVVDGTRALLKGVATGRDDVPGAVGVGAGRREAGEEVLPGGNPFGPDGQDGLAAPREVDVPGPLRVGAGGAGRCLGAAGVSGVDDGRDTEAVEVAWQRGQVERRARRVGDREVDPAVALPLERCTRRWW